MENHRENRLIKLIRASKPVRGEGRKQRFSESTRDRHISRTISFIISRYLLPFFPPLPLSFLLSSSPRRFFPFSPPSALKPRIKRRLCRGKSVPTAREIKRGSRHCGRRTRRAQSADNYDVQLALITDLFLIRGTG